MLKNAREKNTNMFIYLLRLLQEVAVNYRNHDKRLPAGLSFGGFTTASIKRTEKKNTFPDSTTVVAFGKYKIILLNYALRIDTCDTH